MGSDEPITAYKTSSKISKFDQPEPGSDAHMEPLAEHTKLEKWDENGKPYLEEYKGSEKLKNKKVIITGGDSGIGRSVAIFAAREGADVTITYLPAEEHDAKRVEELVKKEGREILLVQLNLLDGPPAIEKAIKAHVDKFGRIDVLFNNASTQKQCKDLTEIDPAIVNETVQTNIVGMILVTKYALPHMKRGCTIVNSTSVTAFKGSAGMVDYSATKGAILAFTRSLAVQQAPNGIRVNCIAPGPVYTPLQPASRAPEQMEGWGLGEIPLHGRVGQPAELGPAYMFAAAADSNFMTGCTLHVNGGQFYA